MKEFNNSRKLKIQDLIQIIGDIEEQLYRLYNITDTALARATELLKLQEEKEP